MSRPIKLPLAANVSDLVGAGYVRRDIFGFSLGKYLLRTILPVGFEQQGSLPEVSPGA